MTDPRDQWWRSQFARLLARELAGVPPISLSRRWLLLASRTWPASRWRVTFDLPDHIYHILDDLDMRTNSDAYARRQWAEAQEWLNG